MTEHKQVTRAQFDQYWTETFTLKFQDTFGGLDPDTMGCGPADHQCHENAKEHQWANISGRDITEEDMMTDADMFFKLAAKIRAGDVAGEMTNEILVQLTSQAADDLAKKGLFCDEGLEALDIIAAKTDDPESMTKARKMMDDLKQANPDIRELEGLLLEAVTDKKPSGGPTITAEELDRIFADKLEPLRAKHAPGLVPMPEDVKQSFLAILQDAGVNADFVQQPLGGMAQMIEITLGSLCHALSPDTKEEAIEAFFRNVLLNTLASIITKAKFSQILGD